MKNAGPSSADPVFCDRRRDAARGGRRKESLEKRTQRAGAAVFSGGGGFRKAVWEKRLKITGKTHFSPCIFFSVMVN